MSPENPPDDRRKDVNTRKVIEVLKAHQEEREEAWELRLAGFVKYERLLYILAATGLAIVSASWVVTTMAASRVESKASGAVADVRELRQDTGAAVQLVREELKETRNDIRAVYRSVRTNTPERRLATPVPDLPPNPITTPESKEK